MDPASMSLLLDMIVKGVGVAKEIQRLARRIQVGEVISLEEIRAEQTKVNSSVAAWDNIAGIEAAVKEDAKEVADPNGENN